MNIKNENYYIIYAWMQKELKLKGAEKEVFALIYSFCKENGSFDGSQSYIADITGYSRKRINEATASLAKKGFIEIFPGKDNSRLNQYKTAQKYMSHNVTNDCNKTSHSPVTNCNNTCNETSNQLSQNVTDTCNEMLHNNYTHNDIYNYSDNDSYSEKYEKVIKAYADNCHTLPRAKMLTERRKSYIVEFDDVLKRYSLSADEYFKKVNRSDYLSGRNGKWTGCSFDWLIKKDNAVKVAEGVYDNKKSAACGIHKLQSTPSYNLEEFRRRAMMNTDI